VVPGMVTGAATHMVHLCCVGHYDGW